MSSNSKIEWCDASWNPIRSRVRQDAPEIARAKGYTSLIQIVEKNIGKVGWHCEHASTGCDHCYAESLNHRCLPGCGTGLPYDRRSRDLVELFLDEEELLKPLKWKPRRIFVESMSDWCATFVTDEMRDRIMAVAALCYQHTFLCLTKRAKECAEYFGDEFRTAYIEGAAQSIYSKLHPEASWESVALSLAVHERDLRHCHLGFSAENQECFDERWIHMWKLAAAGWKVWVSIEPMLSAIDIWDAVSGGKPRTGGPQINLSRPWEVPEPLPRLSHVVIGGESGHGARPFDIQWARDIIRQCKAADVPVFCKQLGRYPEEEITAPRDGHKWMRRVVLKDRKGGIMDEWPEDLRIRQFQKLRGNDGSQ